MPKRKLYYNERPICSYPGCNNLAKKRYCNDGRILFRSCCNTHEDIKYNRKRKRYGITNVIRRMKNKIPNDKCSKCGWDYGKCHRHRITSGIEGGKYIPENVIVLCATCHALIHKENKMNEKIKKEPVVITQAPIFYIPPLIEIIGNNFLP